MPAFVNHFKYLLAVAITFAVTCSFAQTSTPGFLLQDEAKLAHYKIQYAKGDPAVTEQVNSLLANADKALSAGTYSVTFQKTKTAPSGDPHDYVSQAPYWWPDPSKPDGKPYIRKDGDRNPEIYLLHDDSQLTKMCEDVKISGLAYYFSGKEAYAQKVVSLLKTWFIDADTRMSPNLNYAQYIPGINDGRGIGIIESRNLTTIPDGLDMIHGSQSLNSQFEDSIKSWFKQYLDWLINSKNGITESKELNNHGTNYDWQVVDFALFTGNDKLAHDIIINQTIPRMDKQFTATGEQPLELLRTRSWEYCSMNLFAWCRLAMLSTRVNIDLWHTQTADGKGIEKCINWFMPYVLNTKKWDHEQIAPINYDEILEDFSMAEKQYSAIDFKAVFAAHPNNSLWY